MPVLAKKNKPKKANSSITQVEKPKDQFEVIDVVRRAGSVVRYHTHRVIGEDTVGLHSYNVAALIILLHPYPSKALMSAAILHDVAEALVGDLPYPAKKQWPQLGESIKKAEDDVMDMLLGAHPNNALTKQELKWLKSCDILEAGLFAKDQLTMGNSNFAKIYGRVVEIIFSDDEIPDEILAFARSRLSASF